MSKKLWSLLFIAVLTLSLLALAGCAGQEPAAQEPAETEEPVAEEPAERIVTDMAGRQVTLPGEINSIGTLGSVGVLNAFVELMGCGDKIVNEMPARFTKSGQWAMQYEFAPQIVGGPIFEDADKGVQVEVILQHQPDVCITMTKETAETLAENGVACIYLEWKDNEDIYEAVTLMGEVLGKQDIAAQYLDYFDASVAEAAGLTAGITEKRTVLYGSVVNLSQPHIIAEWWISAAGAVSATDNGRTDESFTYTLEDLLVWAPDVLILTGNEIEEIQADDRLADIPAVANSEMYTIPTVAHVWGNRTVEQPLTIFWTMNKVYPEIMTDELLAEKIKDFYSTFFLYDMSDEQVAAIIGG